MAGGRLNYLIIKRQLAGTKGNHIGMPLGRPNAAQMDRLKKKFPEWTINIDKYDPFGSYVNFVRKVKK